MKIKKAFTLIELVIVIGIIGMISALLIPMLMEAAEKQKSEIVNIYNKRQKTVRIFNGKEITEEESKSYKLDHIEYKDSTIYEYFVNEE